MIAREPIDPGARPSRALLAPLHAVLVPACATLAVLLACAVLALLASVGVCAAQAEGTHEAPHWYILARSAPSNLAPGQRGEIVAQIINLGDAPLSATEGEPVQISDRLPAGIQATGPMEGYAARGDDYEGQTSNFALSGCEALPVLRCPYVGTLPPYVAIEVRIPVVAEPPAPGQPSERVEENEITVQGANAPAKAIRRPITISANPTSFGVERYELSPENEDGSPDQQAGSHPFQLTTTIALNQGFEASAIRAPAEKGEKKEPAPYPSAPALLRNLTTTLPAGLVADTRSSVIAQCSAVAFSSLHWGDSNECPASSAVGVAVVTFKEPHFFPQQTASVPVFNLVPETGEPARFGFIFEKVPVVLDTSLQTGKGYAVQVQVKDTSQAAELLSSVVTIWGVPGAPQHDNARGWACLGGGMYVEGLEPRPPCPSGQSSAPPYLIMPTSACATPLESSTTVQSWLAGAEMLAPVQASESESLQGCERLPFEPSLTATPDEHQAATPTGLEVEVTVPQDTTLSATGLGEADIKDTTLTLPVGMAANSAAAGGLAACPALESDGVGMGFEPGPGVSEEAQLENDRFSPGAVSCPAASKIGSVQIKTPLLEDELTGWVYLAAQNTDPFASPLALYLVAEDPKSGTRIKLAGEVAIDPVTGQLRSTFKNTPPLPFETLQLHLFDGERASQSTPSRCASYESVASFAPSTGLAPVQSSSGFAIEPNRDGQPCPSTGPLGFAPELQAGSTSSQAGAYSSFTLTIKRPDADQALNAIGMTLPPGLSAKLASLTPCPEPAHPYEEWACTPESLIGQAVSQSGLGSDPVSLEGQVYLTSGYDGAPFGLLVATHAKAGPFDLGIVNVRSRVNINPSTAQVTITSDPGPRDEILPTILRGVPVQLKQINVNINRPEFQLNPTSCQPMTIGATLGGEEGASQQTTQSFQATNCANLPFTPKLTASAGAHASKQNGTSLQVKVSSPGIGQTGIAKVNLQLPKTLPSRLTTIQKACLATVFQANPAACDQGSVIGDATIRTPILKDPLSGPGYLVSHGNAAFPDVEFVLQGEGITIVLDGKTQIKKGITYSRFESVPDAPFTQFEALLPAGPHSALTADVPEKDHYSLCGQKPLMPTTITAQNGAVLNQLTPIALSGCAAVKAYKTKTTPLARALNACRTKHNKHKRAECERQARRKYALKACGKDKSRHKRLACQQRARRRYRRSA